MLEKKTKKDIVDIIFQENKIDKKEISKNVDSVFGAVKTIIQEGSMIEIRGFGTFEIKLRKRKNAVNPKTGETIEVKPHYTVTFKPGVEIKSHLNTLNPKNNE